MQLLFKILGGAAGAAILFFGAATVTGHVMAEKKSEAGPRITAQDVFGLPDDEAEKKPAQAAAVAPAPKPVDQAFVIKRILPIQGPIKYGEWHWDDADVPAGPLVVTVDLEARVISVFRNGYEIGAAAVLLGTDDHPTPLGVFPILEMKKDHVSNLYDADMPYMMRLTWDGITIHGAPVENGYASHGCIGTPNEFAAKLFSVARKGDKVIITNGKTAQMGSALLES